MRKAQRSFARRPLDTRPARDGVRRCAAIVALAALAAGPVAAQGKFDAKLMQRYGGVLAPECANYLLPQLKYLGDSLVVSDGGKAVLTGRNPKAAPNHFGATPPPEFETAITSDVGGGEAMTFVFFRSPAGLFASVEGGPKVMAALPPALKGKRVRHCDPNRNVAPGAPPPAQIGAPDMLKDAKFRQAYLQALGPLAKEPWLARLDGPAPLVKTVKVAGTDYQLVSACKNHDCFDNNILLLYAVGSQATYGKVLQGGRPIIVGAPPPDVASEIEKLWKAEWRSGK